MRATVLIRTGAETGDEMNSPMPIVDSSNSGAEANSTLSPGIRAFIINAKLTPRGLAGPKLPLDTNRSIGRPDKIASQAARESENVTTS